MAFAHDTFTADNGTLLVNRPSDSGHDWHLVSGAAGNNAQILDNQLASGGSNGTFFYLDATPTGTDYDVELDVQSPGSAGGPLGRCSTSQNTHYSVGYQAGGANRWELWRGINGSFTLLGQYSGDAPTTTRRVKLQMRGSAITVFIDGVARISVTDNNITAAGRPGVYMVATSTWRGDNFEASPAIVTISDNSGADYAGTDDTQLRQNNPNANFGSLSTMETTIWDVGDTLRGLVRFPGLANITGPVTVLSATLRLYLQTANAGTHTIGIFRVLRNWVEGQATWNNYASGNAWAGGGASGAGDTVATASASVAVGTITGQYYEWSSATLAADVEGWINGDFTNNGWLLRRTDIADPPAGYVGQDRAWRSSENSDGTLPELIVEYGTPDGGTAIVRVVGETAETDEAASRVNGLTRLRAETLESPESRASRLGLTRRVDEDEEGIEQVRRLMGLRRLIAETVRAGEALARAFGYRRLVAENVSVADPILGFLGLRRQRDETIAAGEARNTQLGVTRLHDETIEAGEGRLSARGIIRLYTEAVQIADALVRVIESVAQDVVRVVSETVSVFTSPIRGLGIARVWSDALSAVEGRIRHLGIARRFNESVRSQEGTRPLVGKHRIVAEAENTVEGITRRMGLARVLTEAASVAESLVRSLGLVRHRHETAALAEAPLYRRGLSRIVAETLSIAEILTKRVIDGVMRTVRIAFTVRVRPAVDLRVEAKPAVEFDVQTKKE